MTEVITKLPPEHVVANATTQVLLTLGEDPAREGLKETPLRVGKFWLEVTRGLREEPGELFKAFEKAEDDQLISIGPVEFYSVCEHHLVPFFGRAWLGYVPGEQIVGLSKVPRLIELLAAKPQVQERLTGEIADTFIEHLAPQGVGVCLEARHLCAEMRGVRTKAPMRTTALRGLFLHSQQTRQEWLGGLR